jgi:hypothetical protein
VLFGKGHKARRTSVRAAARALAAEFGPEAKENPGFLDAFTSHTTMVQWLQKRGGVTGFHNKQRADKRKAEGRTGTVVTLTVRGDGGEAIQKALNKGEVTLLLAFAEAGRLQARSLVCGVGTVDVWPADVGNPVAELQVRYGGEVIENDLRGTFLRAPTSALVFSAIHAGELTMDKPGRPPLRDEPEAA